jgi:hypothetical protein
VDLDTERGEAQRTANLLSAAMRDAFYYVLDLEDDGPYSVDDVFKPLKFNKLAGAQAELLIQHTGWQSVFLKAEPPLLAWIPQRMTFQVRPVFLKEWKQIVVSTLTTTEETLRQELAEMVAAEAEEESIEEVDEIQTAASAPDTDTGQASEEF